MCDSRAATGALNHGGSPSVIYNNQLRRLLPDLLATDLIVATLWIPSEANPADAPSPSSGTTRPSRLPCKSRYKAPPKEWVLSKASSQNYMRAHQYEKAIDGFKVVVDNEDYDDTGIRAQAHNKSC